jgi:hypothetical protein
MHRQSKEAAAPSSPPRSMSLKLLILQIDPPMDPNKKERKEGRSYINQILICNIVKS